MSKFMWITNPAETRAESVRHVLIPTVGTLTTFAFAFRFAPSEGKLAAFASWNRFDLPRMRKGDDPKTNARGGNRVYNLLGDFTDTRARAETDELRWNRR